MPESTPTGFCVLLSDPDPKSLFNFGSSKSLCGHFLSKKWVNYGWIGDCSLSLNRSRILKLEKLPDTDPDSEMLEQERSWSLRK